MNMTQDSVSIPDFKTAEERSKWIEDHADYWTAVRFRGRGYYERREFIDRQSAEKAARRMANDSPGRPVMIYAVAGTHDSFVTAITPEGK
jgi:hypothetical protein